MFAEKTLDTFQWKVVMAKMIALGMTVMLSAAGHPKCLKMKDKMSVAGKILEYWVLDGKKVADWLSKVFLFLSDL